MHCRHIERGMVVPGIFFKERKRSGVIVDEVAIAFPLGLKTGMKGEGDFLNLENNDVGRKIAL